MSYSIPGIELKMEIGDEEVEEFSLKGTSITWLLSYIQKCSRASLKR